jgi:hypothetical protein
VQFLPQVVILNLGKILSCHYSIMDDRFKFQTLSGHGLTILV